MTPQNSVQTPRPTIFGLVLILALGGGSAAAFADPLKSEALTELFSGNDAHFTLEERPTNGWNSAQWKFAEGGDLAGYLFSSAYIASRKPLDGLDNGLWRVSGDKLCIQWERWSGGEEHCYVIDQKDDGYMASGATGMLGGAFTLVK